MLYFNMGKYILAKHQPVVDFSHHYIHKHCAYALASDNHLSKNTLFLR